MSAATARSEVRVYTIDDVCAIIDGRATWCTAGRLVKGREGDEGTRRWYEQRAHALAVFTARREERDRCAGRLGASPGLREVQRDLSPGTRTTARTRGHR